jgi:hypothetical protein
MDKCPFELVKRKTERRYVNTFLKLLYYNHALGRFDKTKSDRAKEHLLILWAVGNMFRKRMEKAVGVSLVLA